ncbi:MAG: 1-(5-phosphoribosyl)-5-[(5-phosphoribosylamino)methylideneamino]imidazole-4-carboxamide isomerase [Dehalococcoidia bacterium]|nr:1-(5-phosphoribosyl)-5-[(5-phosphoribosylamino)methylideneamino]imidazole-4-carboxamide isomerase [Dehalococcoidia bacterium]
MTPFEVIPAIDLREGRCVRLFQGDYAKQTVYSDDPAAMARRWQAAGATRLHVVDLDAAKDGARATLTAIQAILRAVAIPVQLGGGVRSIAAIHAALDLGVDRAIIGTAAVEDPALLAEAGATFGSRVFVGLDARDGYVAVRGWLQTTSRQVAEVAAEAARAGVGGLIVTDIARDGALAGPNLDAVRAAVMASGLPVIASGGVSSVADVLAARAAGAAGVITGRAIYDGTLDLAAAIRAVAETPC